MRFSNWKADHSVLLRFIAPGSFSCNLGEKRQNGRKSNVGG